VELLKFTELFIVDVVVIITLLVHTFVTGIVFFSVISEFKSAATNGFNDPYNCHFL